jgi:hypothetical protein
VNTEERLRDAMDAFRAEARRTVPATAPRAVERRRRLRPARMVPAVVGLAALVLAAFLVTRPGGTSITAPEAEAYAKSFRGPYESFYEAVQAWWFPVCNNPNPNCGPPPDCETASNEWLLEARQACVAKDERVEAAAAALHDALAGLKPPPSLRRLHDELLTDTQQVGDAVASQVAVDHRGDHEAFTTAEDQVIAGFAAFCEPIEALSKHLVVPLAVGAQWCV